MAKRAKPRTPEQIAAERIARRAKELEAVNIPADAASLNHGQDIEVTRKNQKRGEQKADHDGARRLDAFEALRAGMPPGAYDAARRFEADLLVRRGEADRGRPMERVDCTAGLTTDAMVAAAQRIEAVSVRLPPRDWWLVMELIAPRRDYDGHEVVWVDDAGEIQKTAPFYGWRAVVAFITGETHTHAQGAAVRSACVNLRDAYLALEHQRAA